MIMKRTKMISLTSAMTVVALTLGSTFAFAATSSSSSAQTVGTNPPSAIGQPTSGQNTQHPQPPRLVSPKELAIALNISASTLKSDLQSGMSILDIATKQGIDPSTLEQTLTTYVNNQIQSLITRGKMTSTQASNAEARFAHNLPTMLAHKGLPPRAPQGAGAGGTAQGAGGAPQGAGGAAQGSNSGGQLRRPPSLVPPKEMATALNISASTLGSDLRSGMSILDIATKQGIDQTTLEQTLTTYVNHQIQSLVSSGKMTSTQASNAEKRFSTNLPTMLSHKGFPPRGPQGQHGGAPQGAGGAPQGAGGAPQGAGGAPQGAGGAPQGAGGAPQGAGGAPQGAGGAPQGN